MKYEDLKEKERFDSFIHEMSNWIWVFEYHKVLNDLETRSMRNVLDKLRTFAGAYNQDDL